MHSIDIKEKKQLKEWIQHHAENTFDTDDNGISYFKERSSDDSYIMEYGFSNIADLKALMEKISRGSMPDEVRSLLAVAAFKAKPETVDSCHTISNEQKNIPEFIYVF